MIKRGHSILSENTASGDVTLLDTNKKIGFTGSFKLQRQPGHDIFDSKSLLFHMNDKAHTKQFFDCSFNFSEGFIKNSKALKNHIIPSSLAAKIWLLLLTAELFLAIYLGFIPTGIPITFKIPRVLEILLLNLAFYMTYSSITLFVYYNVNHRIRDTYNALLEFKDIIKVFQKIKPEILKYFPYISSDINTVMIQSIFDPNNLSEYPLIKNAFKDMSAIDKKSMFKKIITFDDVAYSCRLIIQDNILFVLILPSTTFDIRSNYITYDIILQHIKNNTLKDCFFVNI